MSTKPDKRPFHLYAVEYTYEQNGIIDNDRCSIRSRSEVSARTQIYQQAEIEGYKILSIQVSRIT